MFSPVPLWTDAGVPVHSINALRSILTLIVFTVIVVQLTMLTHKAWSALTPDIFEQNRTKCMLIQDQNEQQTVFKDPAAHLYV